MIKTRLYEDQENEEDMIMDSLDTSNYDVIILGSKPYDLLNKYEYRAILTRKKENAPEEEGEFYGSVNDQTWILNIIMKSQGHWTFTPGRWYVETVKEHDSDTISIDGGTKWEVSGIIDIMQEALDQIDEYESKNAATEQYNKPKEDKVKDYSKMRKEQLEKEVSNALDNNVYETLRKIQPYIKESIVYKKINEAIKMKDASKILMGHNTPKEQAIKDIKSETGDVKIQPWRFKEGLPFNDEDNSEDVDESKKEVCKECGKIKCECEKLKKEVCKKCGKVECECDKLEEDFIMPRLSEKNLISEEKIDEGCCPGPKRPARPKPSIFRPRPKLDEDYEMPSLFEQDERYMKQYRNWWLGSIKNELISKLGELEGENLFNDNEKELTEIYQEHISGNARDPYPPYYVAKQLLLDKNILKT